MKLSEKLIKLRKEKGLSQEEFGNIVGVSRQAVSKWENEEATPDIDKIKEIVKKFNINYEYILNDEIEDKENNQETNQETEKTQNNNSSSHKKNKHKTLTKTILIIFLLYLSISTYKFIAFYRFYLIANSFKEENYTVSQTIESTSNISYYVTTKKIGNKIQETYYPQQIEETIKDQNGTPLPYAITYIDYDKKINYQLNYNKEQNKYEYYDNTKSAINEEEKEQLFTNKNIIKEKTLGLIPSGFKEIFLASIDPRYYYVSISNRQYKSISFADDLTKKVQLNKDYVVESANIQFKDYRGTVTFNYSYDYVPDHFKEREIEDPQEKYLGDLGINGTGTQWPKINFSKHN